MPGFDRTGPLGQGPRTGRGLGYCAGGRFADAQFGLGYGAGRGGVPRGGGRGRAWGGGHGRFGPGGFLRAYDLYWSHPAKEIFNDMIVTERERLEAAMSDLQAEIDSIKKRLEEIAKEEG